VTTLFPTTALGAAPGLDADLERVLDAWPTLRDALKAGILDMIVATARKG
jgi:hypothetical protein